MNDAKQSVVLMPAKRIRVELFDDEGNRYTIAFEGQITREKAVRLLDLVELLGGIPSSGSQNSTSAGTVRSEISKYDRVHAIVKRSFPAVWFSSREAQTAYEQDLKNPISLSTVATYLARLANRGVLLRAGASNSLRYKLVQNVQEVQVRHPIQ